MKRYLAGTALALTALFPAFADESIIFESHDGSTYSLSAENIAITFHDGLLSATNGIESRDMELSSLRAFYFGETTALTSLESASCTPFDVFDASGVYMGNFSSLSEMKNALPFGTYIIKSSEGTVKLILK